MDVVYPVPGSSTKYPENEIGALYKELLGKQILHAYISRQGLRAL